MGSRKFWRVVVLMALTTLALSACGGTSGGSGGSSSGGSSSGSGGGGGSQSGAITVGVVAPFTGPAAEFGKLLSAPCFAATDLINKAGGCSVITCSARRSMTRGMPPTRYPM